LKARKSVFGVSFWKSDVPRLALYNNLRLCFIDFKMHIYFITYIFICLLSYKLVP
jgi:hypothetical protein